MKIEVRNRQLYVDGVLSTWAGLTDFSLFYKFVKGIDITPIVQNRQQIYAETQHVKWMFRSLRVSSQAANIFQMKPGDYSYDSVTAFTNFVYELSGLAIQWEAEVDCVNSRDERRKHFSEMVNALLRSKYGSYVLSAGNEWQKNGWSPDDVRDLRPSFVASLGSSLGGENPNPGWGVSLYHSKRDGTKGYLGSCDLAYAKQGYSGENGSVGWPGCGEDICINDECIGFQDVSIYGKRTSNPQVAYQTAFEASVAGNGGNCHINYGITSDIVPVNSVEWAHSQAYMVGVALADPVQSWNGAI